MRRSSLHESLRDCVADAHNTPLPQDKLGDDDEDWKHSAERVWIVVNQTFSVYLPK